MIISNSKKFIYIHLHKTGGTSIEEALTPYLEWDDYIFGGLSFGMELENLYAKYFGWKNIQEKGLSKHSSAEKIKKLIGNEKWNNFYKFSTIRDPKELMISFYYYTKKSANDIEKESYSHLINKGLDGFIQDILFMNIEPVNPQIKRLNYDKTIDLYNIKNIQKTWPIILEKIGFDKNIKLPITMKTFKDEGIILSKYTQSLIENHFKDDYEILEKSI